MKNWQPLGLALALVVGLWLGRGCGAWESGHDLSRGRSFHEHMGGSGDQARLMNVLHRIEDLYVDTFDRTRLVDVAIEAMLDELDPHTVYFSGEELASMSENMEGNFEGIGVEFLIQQDTLMVVAAIPGGPSDKAGIRAGDRIVAVEGEAISGPELDNSRVMKLLKGPRGTEVNLGIDRRGEPFQVHLIRDRIPIQSVVASFMLEEEVGYVKAIRFAANTAQEFEGALFSLAAQGATSLVVDLRGNGGGYLNAVVDMLDLFLDEGQTMVYTEGKSSPRRNYISRRRGPYVDWPVVVLVDEGSASASEIFAGAVQDNDRGLVVGRRTFGKGLVQEEFPVPGSGALRLTVARFYTPTGRAIQKPYDAYEEDFDVRLASGELYHADSMPLVDSLKYTTPMGREVFGGGASRRRVRGLGQHGHQRVGERVDLDRGLARRGVLLDGPPSHRPRSVQRGAGHRVARRLDPRRGRCGSRGGRARRLVLAKPRRGGGGQVAPPLPGPGGAYVVGGVGVVRGLDGRRRGRGPCASCLDRGIQLHPGERRSIFEFDNL